MFGFKNSFNRPQGQITHGVSSSFGPLVYRSRPKIFHAILIHFDAKFQYHVVAVHTSPSGGAVCHKFYAFYPGALNCVCLFVCYKKQFLGVDPQGSK